MTVRWSNDVAEYLERVETFLCASPVEHSVLLTSAHRCAGGPVEGQLWLWVEADGAVVAVAQQVPPWQAYVSVGSNSAMGDLAKALRGFRPELGGVGGMRPAAEAFARRWRELTGRETATAMTQGVYVANEVRHPTGIPGRMRLGEAADVPLIQAWSDGFSAELGGHAPRLDVGPWIEHRRVFIWEVDAQEVSVAMAHQGYGGVARVSMVYTPPEHRRRGYAGAVVAGVTARQLEAGLRCMLYTDLANPTSNGVYQRVGYRQMCEAVDVRFS